MLTDEQIYRLARHIWMSPKLDIKIANSNNYSQNNIVHGIGKRIHFMVGKFIVEDANKDNTK